MTGASKKPRWTLVEGALDGMRAKTGEASVPNTAWEYLLRSGILSLAVRLVGLIFP